MRESPIAVGEATAARTGLAGTVGHVMIGSRSVNPGRPFCEC
jgi:hypothetical protein